MRLIIFTLCLLILLPCFLFSQSIPQSGNDSVQTNESFNADSNDVMNSKNDSIAVRKNVEKSGTPLPTPIWRWILYFVFGASGFGMMLNKRVPGFIVFGIVLYFMIQDFQTAITNDYPIWPFLVFLVWIFLTKNIAKKLNQQVLGNQSKIARTGGSKAAQLADQAFVEIEHQNFEKARELLEESLRLYDKIPEAHSEYAFVMSAQGYLDKAIDHIIKAVLLRKREAKFWSNLAYQYYLDKQYIKAMTSTFIAEIVNPSYKSIATSKQMIKRDFSDYERNIENSKIRANEIWKAINSQSDGLPIQSGDINQLMDPAINFFL